MTCSWCGHGIPQDSNVSSVPHSHGICKACTRRELSEGLKAARRLRRELDAYVDAQQASERPGPVERTLSTLYGVPLTLVQTF